MSTNRTCDRAQRPTDLCNPCSPVAMTGPISAIAKIDQLQSVADIGRAPRAFLGHRERLRDRQQCPGSAARVERGGEGGIRTPDTVARMPHFECGAFNHSATSPLNCDLS